MEQKNTFNAENYTPERMFYTVLLKFSHKAFSMKHMENVIITKPDYQINIKLKNHNAVKAVAALLMKEPFIGLNQGLFPWSEP